MKSGSGWPPAGLGRIGHQVADALRAAGPSTRAVLGSLTGLSRPSVAAAIGTLLELGLAEPHEDVARPGRTGGRPAEIFRLTRRAGLAVGVDIGRRHIEVVLADLAHREVASGHLTLDQDAELRPGQVLDQAADLVRTLLRNAGSGLDEVIGVGLGIPAPITREGLIGSRTFLPAWAETNPRAELGARLGVSVDIDNDASLGALGEYVFGAGRGSDRLTYIKVATGIGSGTVLHGRMLRGAAGTAGELGHVTISFDGPWCTCGNRGCVELYAGGGVLLREAQSSVDPPATLDALVDRAIGGDPLSQRLISKAGDFLGIALGSLVNLQSPDRIVVGGQLSEAGDILLMPVVERLRRTAIGAASAAVTVTRGELGRRASAWGSVALVLKSADPAVAQR